MKDYVVTINIQAQGSLKAPQCPVDLHGRKIVSAKQKALCRSLNTVTVVFLKHPEVIAP